MNIFDLLNDNLSLRALNFFQWTLPFSPVLDDLTVTSNVALIDLKTIQPHSHF